MEELDIFKIINGDMIKELDNYDDNTFDSIICDPPYELNYMNKSWDNSGISFQKETWEKCLRVLKPGGHLLAFGGSRTFHRIACAIEDAGFEIRDTIMWLYGSAMPKSMNIGLKLDERMGVESKVIGVNEDILKKQAKDLREGHRKIVDSFNAGAKNRNNGFKTVSADIKEPASEEGYKWKGWGTQLKPAFEPIIMARKPVEESIIDNILRYDVGGLNIDECRVPAKQGEYDIRHYTKEDCFQNLKPKTSQFQVKPQPSGRFPANVILTYSDEDKDEVCSGFPIGGQNGSITKRYDINNRVYGDYGKCNTWEAYSDSGSAARYYYCAKPSSKDRDEGLEELINKHNTHSAVKPTELLQYLVRLVTPKDGIVLDPFMGSGSVGKAIAFENRERNANYKYVGIELDEEYCTIANARISYANNVKIVQTIDKEEKIVTEAKPINHHRKLF
jgi:site-specific DNA-methyltransferase (adenine-specific)